MTTTDDTKLTEILRDIAAAIVERPGEIRAAAQPAEDGACYFALKGHREDESKLVGTGGSHVDALAFLVAAAGAAAGRAFTFRLITEGNPERRPPNPPRDVIDHDPNPARELLRRMLDRLDLRAFEVEVGPGNGPRNSLTFLFSIRVKEEDYRRLTAPPFPPGFEDGRFDEQTVVGALGTLFRAIAKKAGVRYSLTVREP